MTDITTITIADLAAETAGRFVVKTRDNGDRFYTIAEDKQEDWIQELCMEAHGDMMPDDWRYEMIHGALEAIAGAGDDYDDAEDHLPEAPIMTHDLSAYRISHGYRLAGVDEAMSDFDLESVDQAIAWAYHVEQREVLESVRQSLQDRLDELEA